MDEQQSTLFHEVPHPVSLVASPCPPTLRLAPTQGAVLERATWMARDTQHEMVDFCADWCEDVYGPSDNLLKKVRWPQRVLFARIHYLLGIKRNNSSKIIKKRQEVLVRMHYASPTYSSKI